MNHTTEVWSAVKPLVDAGWLEKEEVMEALQAGLGYKPGITEKVIAALTERAANLEHRREQKTMHHYNLTRKQVRLLLDIDRMPKITSTLLKRRVGLSVWPDTRDWLATSGWLIYIYAKNGRTIKGIEATKELRLLAEQHRNWRTI